MCRSPGPRHAALRLPRRCLGPGDLHIMTTGPRPAQNPSTGPRSTDHGRARGKKTRLLIVSSIRYYSVSGMCLCVCNVIIHSSLRTENYFCMLYHAKLIPCPWLHNNVIERIFFQLLLQWVVVSCALHMRGNMLILLFFEGGPEGLCSASKNLLFYCPRI